MTILHRGAWADSEPMVYMTYPSCSGPCEQGRFACPTPAACEVTEPWITVQPNWVLGLLAGGLILAVIGVCFLLAMVTV